MNWVLFIQIEAIILTIGFVAIFVIGFHQNVKDNAFAKRITAAGKALEAWGKSVPNKPQQPMPSDNAIREWLEKIAKTQKEEEHSK